MRSSRQCSPWRRAAALTDGLWERYALGSEHNVKDPTTQQPAKRNPFWHRAPSPVPGIVMPTLADLLQRGAIVLVCDFALGHLSKRLAAKSRQGAEAVHRDLRDGFVPGAFAVPSGIFGLARSQNSGCAYVRM
jgi:intracellular sulfur oxidation DsrE/DsrF family protein